MIKVFSKKKHISIEIAPVKAALTRQNLAPVGYGFSIAQV